jgi:hypothetical protein
MTDDDEPTRPVNPDDRDPDDPVPGDYGTEVPTTFATKGLGWSGREKDDLTVMESDAEATPHTFRRSKPASG